MARAIVVIPPLIKYDAGPMLGPAMLAGAARSGGHDTFVCDLAIAYLRSVLGTVNEEAPTGIFGDHRKPPHSMAHIESRFLEQCRPLLGPGVQGRNLGVDPALGMLHSHVQVTTAADRLRGQTEFDMLVAPLFAKPPPCVVGLSVMFGCQVLWALAISRAVRERWPTARVVWGGSHVTALETQIRASDSYACAADYFVAGYAEQTWCDFLDAVDRGDESECHTWFRAGSASSRRAIGLLDTRPHFGDVSPYESARLTLPAQVSRGCAYGRCAYCTYPKVEGKYHYGSADLLTHVVDEAIDAGAAISLKDSLLTPPVLQQVAQVVGGRVHWSGCTKLHSGLPETMNQLAASGCKTLEIGVETFVTGSQRLVNKVQSYDLFARTLRSAADCGVGLVVNYMIGFPGEDRGDADRHLERVRCEVSDLVPRLKAIIQVNRFELERLAPLAQSKAVNVIAEWPWSSLLDWQVGTEQPDAAGTPALTQVRVT